MNKQLHPGSNQKCHSTVRCNREREAVVFQSHRSHVNLQVGNDRNEGRQTEKRDARWIDGMSRQQS